MNENTLVKLYNTGSDLVAVSTYGRTAGRHGRFLIDEAKLNRWIIDGHNGRFFDRDCGNYVEITWRETRVRVNITWISYYGDGTIRGIDQTFYIDADVFLGAAQCRNTVVLLCKAEDCEVQGKTVWHESAMKNISRMTARQRRAFCKALRRGSVQWPNTTTDVYADGTRSFFFRTNDGLCGGLIYSDYNGKSIYSVHT